MREKIANIIYDELSYIYCFNCRNEDDDDSCEVCYRKYMNWAIGKSTAEEIADKIIKEMEK